MGPRQSGVLETLDLVVSVPGNQQLIYLNQQDRASTLIIEFDLKREAVMSGKVYLRLFGDSFLRHQTSSRSRTVEPREWNKETHLPVCTLFGFAHSCDRLEGVLGGRSYWYCF